MSIKQIQNQVNLLKNAAKAKQALKFFKTGPGQYGEGDIFAGLTNPECRKIAAEHKHITIKEAQELLSSQIHEERFIALVIMQHLFKKKENEEGIYQAYLRNLRFINNWDLVDLSAPNIIGKYLLKRCEYFDAKVTQKDPRTILYSLAQSKILWQRRISIISTLSFIRQKKYIDTLNISKILLPDKQDLIHKSVGWMLREVGKRQQALLEQFLQSHYQKLPRTMLRYAIQKFPQQKRQSYLKGAF